MTNQTKPAAGDKGTEAKKRRAKGVFPRLPMAKTVELASAIYKLGHREPVRRRTVFDELQKSPDSGTSRALVVAANSGYGLVDGSYASEYLEITDVGLRLVSAESERDRYEASYEALFENEIFAGLVTYFNDRPVPIDEVAVDYLKKNHGLMDPDARACWEVFRENLVDYGLVQELSGKKVIVSREAALQRFAKRRAESSSNDGARSLISSSSPDDPNLIAQPTAAKAIGSSGLLPPPHFNFNIQVVLPENASPETYDLIFQSISKHLLRHGEA